MSVREQLGLGADSELLALARQRWQGWADDDPRLAVVDNLEDLRGWLRRAAPDEADPVLLALAMLAAPDGGNDLAAAATLADELVPGASRMACQLGVARAELRAAGSCTVVPGAENPDVLIAAQLWLEVRSFPWRRLGHVAGNILMNTRAAVLAEYGAHSQVARRDRAWAHAMVLDVFSSGAAGSSYDTGGHRRLATITTDQLCVQALAPYAETPHGPTSSAWELASMLAWAREAGVITEQDRRLLECLIEEAWRAHEEDPGSFWPRRNGLGGFASHHLASRVADRVGLAEVTVRRRSARAVRALSAACTEYAEHVA